MNKIVSKYNSKVLWEGEAESIKEAVEKALKDGADLSGANFSDADLSGANLRGANLFDANLFDANLRGADFNDANLSYADLSEIKTDFYKVLSKAEAELPGLYKALVDGKINGSVWEGDCACLNEQKVSYDKIPGLTPDNKRAAEKWFLAIKKGDTPENNHVSAIVKEWVHEYAKENDISLPVRKVVWEWA